MWNSAHVLIVEDNPLDQRVISESFKRSNPKTQTHVIGNGLEALPFLKREGRYRQSPRPDLIVLDLNLPGRSGRDILEEVKLDPSLKCIPVVVLSTSNAPNDIHTVYLSHGNSYITKPFEIEAYTELGDELTEYWLRLVQLSEGEDQPNAD